MDKVFRGLVILVFLLGTGSPAAANNNNFLYLPFISKNWINAPGKIHGVVSNALNMDPVSGADVCYHETCTQTNSLGEYTLTGLPPTYVVLDATKNAFVPQTAGVIVLGNQTVTLNIPMSEQLSNNQIDLRFIVTWRTEESWPITVFPWSVDNDLDSQLWVIAPPEQGLSDHLDPYNNPGHCTYFPDACIEIDTTRGSGPETVDIRQTHPNTTYYFGVLNVNSSYVGVGVPPITESRAKIQVIDKTGLIQTFEVPTVGTGDLWYAFKFDLSKTITSTNCITWMPSDPPNPGDPYTPPECP